MIVEPKGTEQFKLRKLVHDLLEMGNYRGAIEVCAENDVLIPPWIVDIHPKNELEGTIFSLIFRNHFIDKYPIYNLNRQKDLFIDSVQNSSTPKALIEIKLAEVDKEIKSLNLNSLLFLQSNSSVLNNQKMVSDDPLKVDIPNLLILSIKDTFYKQFRTFLKNIKPASLVNTSFQNEKQFKFINKFDKIKEETIESYFKDALVRVDLLSETDLKNYLTLAFEKKLTPQVKFNFNKPYKKKNIRTIFYIYFSIIAKAYYGDKPKYVRLLSDYFEDFDYKNTYDNFRKY